MLQLIAHGHGLRVNYLILLSIVVLVAAGCVKRNVKTEKSGLIHPSTFQPFTGDLSKIDNIQPQLISKLKLVDPRAMDEDTLWALAQCDCAHAASGEQLKQMMQIRGVLPQVLVPIVREEIAADPKLELLNNMPPILGGVVNAVGQIFVSDQNLENEVRESLSDQLSNSLLTPPLNESIPFRFDAFTSPYYLPEQAATAHPTTFKTEDQAVKWAFIFGQSPLWDGTRPLALNNHGLQLLAVGQTLAEWQYVFGLEKASQSQRIYGGLSIDPREGPLSPMAPFDPRTSPNMTPRLITGQYSISYPAAGRDVDKVFQVQEQWFREGNRITLEEQAKVWASAGMAFHRLRPSNRGYSTGAFHRERGMFPDHTHQLPLIFLSSMADMLDGPFIDEKTLDIFAEAKLKGFAQDNRMASPLESMRLARALSVWVKETESLNDANLTESMRQEIIGSRGRLLDALRLSVQHVLAHFLVQKQQWGEHYGYPMSMSKDGLTLPAMGDAAEILATLVDIEQEVLPSELLKEKIAGFYHWFVGHYLDAKFEVGNLDPATILWTQQALKSFSKYPNNQAFRAPWAPSVSSKFEAAVQAWDAAGGQP